MKDVSAFKGMDNAQLDEMDKSNHSFDQPSIKGGLDHLLQVFP